MKYKGLLLFLILSLTVFSAILLSKNGNTVKKGKSENKTEKEMSMQSGLKENIKEIYLAGGCFWGIEAYMERISGVKDATVGYANGKTDKTNYNIIASTDHAETVHVKYDSNKISLGRLLKYYFQVVDPTSVNQQGNDLSLDHKSRRQHREV